MRRKAKFKREGNVVHTTQIGKTTIKICDDFVAQTPEQIEKVLDDLHAAGWAIWNSLPAEKREEINRKCEA